MIDGGFNFGVGARRRKRLRALLCGLAAAAAVLVAYGVAKLG